MKPIFPFLLLFVTTFISFPQKNFSQAVWTEKNGVGWNQPASGVPILRDLPAGFCVNGKTYTGTGYIDHGNGSWWGMGDLNEFDPATNKWTQFFSIPSRDQAQGFSTGNKGYIGFGSSDSIYIRTDLWEFDPTTGAWSQKADFPDTTRKFDFSFGANAKGYVGGGTINDLWEFDPAGNSWNYVDTLPFTGSDVGATFSIGTDGYATGMAMNWKFDALAMSWSAVAPYPGTEAPYYGFELQGKGYIISNVFYQYDPVGDQWIPKAGIPSYGYGWAGSDASFGYFLISDGGVYRYDPAADTWTDIYHRPNYIDAGSKNIILNNLVYANGATYDPVSEQWTRDTNLLNNGWLFALNNCGYALRNYLFQKYDPVSATWTPLNPLSFDLGHVFTCNGKGYSVLSVDQMWQSDPTLHEYDPVTDSWTVKAPYPGTQHDEVITFSILDKGYIVGGVNTNYTRIAEFWQYDPVTDQWMQKADYPGYQKSFAVFAEECYGRGYVGLGMDDATGSAYNQMHYYDPSTDSWIPVTHPISPRCGTSTFVINNALYVGEGHARQSMKYSYHYNDLWMMTDSLAIVTGISSVSQAQFQVFPNPANEFFSISGEKIERIDLFNSNGQRVLSMRPKSSSASLRIECNSFDEGIYFLKMMSGGSDVVKKIVIRKD